MTTQKNVVGYRRGTLGVERLAAEERQWCGTCRHEGTVLRINIDGLWSYLCDGCWQRLVVYVESA